MMEKKLRIAAGGIHIESSTFAPQLAYEKNFAVTRGDTVIGRYEWVDETWARQVDWIGVLHARSLPSGMLDRGTYDRWKSELVEGIRSAHQSQPLDGIFLELHGAMSVVGLEDAEADLVAEIRAAVGTAPIIAASMDLHGNVSEQLFGLVDYLTCYRMAPHEDEDETQRRAAKNLVEYLWNFQVSPCRALVHLPILLPGEKTSTRVEPAKSLYAQIPKLSSIPGIIDVAFWVGFAWADQPRCKAAVVVTGTPDSVAQVQDTALSLANEIWERRHEFSFVAPVDTMENCLEWALTAKRPTFISDSGDNPGAGGANDTVYALEKLLNHQRIVQEKLEVIYASVHDAATVEDAVRIGVGGCGLFSVGGKIDTRPPGAVSVTAEVDGLVHTLQGGMTAVLRPVIEGELSSIRVVVTEERQQFGTMESFECLHLRPDLADIVIVKIGYLEPDLFHMQNDWRMALTPGAVDQDLTRLGHTHINRPMLPFDDDIPGFTPKALTSS